MNNVTQLLIKAGKGNDVEARNALLEAVYQELRIIAYAKMAKEKPGHTLQPTILVNDAWLKLFPDGKGSTFENRAHFFGTAARVMRNLLVDHARHRLSIKRGGKLHKTQLNTEQFGEIQHKASDELIEAVHEALDEIAATDPDTVKVVEMRFFLEMTMKEIAEKLEVSLSTAERSYSEFKIKYADRLKSLV